MPPRRPALSDASRLVRDRAALFLEAQDGPVSSTLLAREVLGLRHGSEIACGSILEPILGPDPRFERAGDGRWVLGEPSPAPSADGGRPLSERVWSVWSIEHERRAAAIVRLEAGRITAEREEPHDPEGAGATVCGVALDVAAWRRLTSTAAGGLPVAWDSPSFIEEAIAQGSHGAPTSAEECETGAGTASGAAAHGILSLPSLARAVLGSPRPRSLELLAGALGITFVEAGSPLARARLAAECLAALLDREPLRDGTLEGMHELLERRARPHPGLEDPDGPLRRDLEALPNEPGVYRFLDAEGRLLYVGKARDLRRRVGSYFLARKRPDPRTAAWLGAVARIEHERSGSELEAILREASQIVRHAPSENRQIAVHERAGRPVGNLALVQCSERPGAVRVALVKDGAIAARIVLGPRGGGRDRLREALERLYFSPEGMARRPSRRDVSGDGASRALLLSWLRRQPPAVPGLDPTDDPGPEAACARILKTAAALLRGETGVTYRS